MQTFLYNTDTNERIGEIRNGYYLVDGVRPNLPSNIVELVIYDIPRPEYNPSIEKLVYTEYVDLSTQQYVKGYVVQNMTQQEIDDYNDSLKPYVPEICTPRQFRLALLDYQIDPDTITQIISNIPDTEERKRVMIIWEYSNSIERNDPLIDQFAQILGVTSQTVDAIFRQAITYE